MLVRLEKPNYDVRFGAHPDKDEEVRKGVKEIVDDFKKCCAKFEEMSALIDKLFKSSDELKWAATQTMDKETFRKIATLYKEISDILGYRRQLKEGLYKGLYKSIEDAKKI